MIVSPHPASSTATTPASVYKSAYEMSGCLAYTSFNNDNKNKSEMEGAGEKKGARMRVLSSHISYTILIRYGEKNYLSPFPLVAHLYILECLPWNVQSSICPPTCLGIESHPCTVRSTGSINLGVRSCLERQNQWKINCLGISL